MPVRVLVNVADPREVDRIDIASCDGIGLMRTEFLFGKGPARRGDAIPRLPQGARMGRWQAGDDPHDRRRGRQAGAGLHGRGRQSVPRPARHPPVAVAAGGIPPPDRALLRAAVHGNLKVMFPMISVPEEYARAARCSRKRPRTRSRRRIAFHAAARHHGRGAVGGDRAGTLLRRRLLLDRLERSDAICDGRGARQYCGRGAAIR